MGPSQVRRRPTAGGYARGEETRLRIVQAALELFGARGYEGVSTREIAAHAGVNPPALQYYFDSKEGLYLACAEHMSARITEMFGPVVADVRARLEGEVDREELIACVCDIQASSANLLMLSTEVEAWMKFMAWEDAELGGAPPAVGRVLDEGVKRDMRDLLCGLVGRIIGKPADDPETRLRVVTINGQISVLHMARQKCLKGMEWAEIDEGRLALIKRVVREQTTAALRVAGQG